MNHDSITGETLPVGYVEAMTETHILGWAWFPGNTEKKVCVELRVGNMIVAEGTANLHREDLAKNGIGDGHHAFSMMVPEQYREKIAEMRVFGGEKEGKKIPIGNPPPALGVMERLDNLQKGLEIVVASQRVLHRNLQTALLQNAGTPKENTTTEALERITEQLNALDVMVNRLEQRSLIPSIQKREESKLGRMTYVSLGMSTAAALLSLWGFVHAVMRA